jgi:hypothetical protein
MAKSNHVITTKAALEQEFHENGWEERLSKCVAAPVDADFEFASNTRSYRRQSLVKHYEDGKLIAFTIDYTLHDDTQIRQLKMLLINGIRNIVQ